jgi:hypothetical protein
MLENHPLKEKMMISLLGQDTLYGEIEVLRRYKRQRANHCSHLINKEAGKAEGYREWNKSVPLP